MYIYVHICIYPERREAPGVAERFGRSVSVSTPSTIDPSPYLGREERKDNRLRALCETTGYEPNRLRALRDRKSTVLPISHRA